MFLRPPISTDEWVKLVRSIVVLEIISIGICILYLAVFWKYEDQIYQIEINAFGDQLDWITIVFFLLVLCSIFLGPFLYFQAE